mmetsp:Transcript_12481/g.47945  ORF Transcript_12481/g.47945 Transcript_12481/m.47945 type:complete len:209 (-) Transcript_12481:82-708(-)
MPRHRPARNAAATAFHRRSKSPSQREQLPPPALPGPKLRPRPGPWPRVRRRPRPNRKQSPGHPWTAAARKVPVVFGRKRRPKPRRRPLPSESREPRQASQYRGPGPRADPFSAGVRPGPRGWRSHAPVPVQPPARRRLPRSLEQQPRQRQPRPPGPRQRVPLPGGSEDECIGTSAHAAGRGLLPCFVFGLLLSRTGIAVARGSQLASK